jgi:tetratricopeptide (TPR) repeat protein
VRVSDIADMWSGRYVTEISELPEMQYSVSLRIAESLALRVAGVKKASTRWKGESRSRELYLMGLYEGNKRTTAGLTKAISYYQQAISIDATNAVTHAALADAYLVSTDWLMLPPAVGYPKARIEALRALQLDPELAEAHVTLAEEEHVYEWNWAQAEKEYRAALRLNPNSVMAHKSYAEFLMHSGRNREAIDQITTARDLDPMSMITNSLVGLIYFFAGDYDRTIAECERVIALEPQFAPAHYFLGGALLQKKRYQQAIGEFKLAKSISPESSMIATGLAHAYAMGGRKELAQRMLDDLQKNARQHYVSPYGIAQVAESLGEHQRALNLLDTAARERSFELVFLGVDRHFESLRGNGRFRNLLAQIGAPI